VVAGPAKVRLCVLSCVQSGGVRMEVGVGLCLRDWGVVMRCRRGRLARNWVRCEALLQRNDSAVVGQRQDSVGCEGSERRGDPRRRGSWLQPRKKGRGKREEGRGKRGKINVSVSFS
jgi:hypothetical protein